MVAAGSTTLSLSSLAVTASLSRETTATCENRAPSGFQHLVQPHAWLCAVCERMVTVTFLSAQRQRSVPPEKAGAAALMPRSIAGWMESAMVETPFGLLCGQREAPVMPRARARLSSDFRADSSCGGRLAAGRHVVVHDRADRLAFVHQVEGVVDALERHHVRDEVVDVDLAFHVPVDDARHVGTAARPAERRAFPGAPGDELEGARLYFLSRARHPDDHRDAPAAMAALECLAHHVDAADALEAVVGAAAGELHQVRHEVAAYLARIDEMREAELARQRLARRIQVHADDLVGPGHARALHDV